MHRQTDAKNPRLLQVFFLEMRILHKYQDLSYECSSIHPIFLPAYPVQGHRDLT